MIPLRIRATLIAALSLAGTAHAGTAQQTASPLQLGFEENRGQAAAGVRYVARGRGQTVLFTDAEVRIQRPAPDGSAAAARLSFPGSTPSSGWEPVGDIGFVSYFLGADPSQWVHGAPRFEKLARRNLYPGVDAVFYGQDNLLEYDLVFTPGADPSAVRVRFEGADGLRMDADGAIEIVTAGGTLRQRAPVIYQERNGARVAVQGRFVRAGSHEFRLEIGAYDPALALTVDPVLESATFLGGENDDQVTFVSEDVVAGNTSSVAFFAAIPQARRSRDIFLSYKARNSVYTFVTIIGGSGDDELAGAGSDIVRRTIYMGGTTTSTDFPMVSGSEYAGGKSDGFLLELQSQADSRVTLAGARYIGGSGEDRVLSFSYIGSRVSMTGFTDSPDLPVQRAFQASPAGGKDAFVANFYGRTIWMLSYLGGSGDDEGSSVVTCVPHLCVAGETRSADFPLEGPGRRELRGASDAFVATLDVASNDAARIVASQLMGGGGEDRINNLSGIAQPIAAVGTTTSPDFPGINPVQTRLGGDSDAFVLTMNSAEGTLLFSSVLGGSGSERGLGIATGMNGDLFVGGSTRSTDLPVVDALQPKTGGGEDGFYGLIGSDRRLRQLTYFGGAGDERINSVGSYSWQAIVGGQTTSDDLPLRNPTQDRKDGGMDGFTAVIGTAYITGPDQLTIGKGLAARLTLGSGQSNWPPLTLRVSDPSKLQILSYRGGLAEMTSASWQFRLQALADGGEVEITASAPGFASKTIKARLYPSVITHSLKAVTALTTFSTPLRLEYTLAALDPETNRTLSGGWLPENTAAPQVTWSVSDERVLRIEAGEPSSWAVPVGPGSAQMTMAAPGFRVWPPDPVTVHVRRPQITAGTPAAAPDLRCPLSYSLTGEGLISGRWSDKSSTITVRSMDPSRLLVSTSLDERGQESVTVPVGGLIPMQTIYLEAFATSGQAGLLITSPDADAPLETTVTLSPPAVQLSYPTFSLAAGSGYTVILRLSPNAAPGTASCSARPGLPAIDVRLVSSDPSVAAFAPATVTYTSPNTIASSLRALAPGTATVMAQPQLPGFQPSQPAAVTVVKAPSTPVVTPEVGVGKDLQTTVSISLTGATGEVEAVVSVDDPSLAVVAPDAASAGAAEIRKRFQGNLQFQVQGLQAAGRTSVRIRVPGAPEIVRVIALGPSGFAFNRSAITQSVAIAAGEAFVGPWLLDDVTGIPLLAQPLRPGVSAQLTVRKDQGEAISLTTSTLTLAGGPQISQRVAWTAQAAGEATLAFDQPQGFTSPSRQTQLRIRISKSSLSLAQTYTVAQDGMLAVMLGSSPVSAFTVTSGDPARLLVSAKPGDAGAASVTVLRSEPFYLSGLVDHGTVPLRASAPNADDAESTVLLSPMAIQISNLPADPIAMLAHGSAWRSTITLIADDGRAMNLRPGAQAVRVNITSSNARVVSVRPAFVEFRPGDTSPQSFELSFDAGGEAEVRLDSPAGYPINRSRILVSVRAPRLLLPEKLVLGKDLQSAVTLTSERGTALKDNLIVTVTSLSPEKLLLSRSSTITGSALLAVPYQAGMSSSQQFYLQALSGEGVALLRITAEGYAESTVNIPLAPAALGLNFAGATVKLRAGDETTFWSRWEAAGTSLAGSGLRPGMAELSVPVLVEDPSIVSVTPKTLVMRPGENPPSVQVRAIAPGATTVSLAVPPGFVAPSVAPQAARVEVAGRLFWSSCGPAGTRAGKDTMAVCSIGAQAGAVLKAVSSDPSRLAVSFDVKTAGAPQATLTAGSDSLSLYVHALAADGAAQVTLSAPGYEDLTIPVVLTPSAFVLRNVLEGSTPSPVRVGSATEVWIALRVQDSQGNFYSPGLLRPGAGPVRVDLTSSDPSVATLSAPSVIFDAGDSAKSVQLNGVRAGSTVIRAATPTGFAAPPRDVVLFTVTP